MAAVHNIHPSLDGLVTAIDEVKPLAGNPRRGDVDAVMASYRRFGQRKPIVVRQDSAEVLAGNHQLAAAKALGWSHIAVVWVADDDQTAAAFALADNRTHDLGTYDDAALAELLAGVDDLEGTGYRPEDLTELLEGLDDPGPAPRADPVERLGYQLVFDTPQQQATFHDFLVWLRKNGVGETIGERVCHFVKEHLAEG